MGIRGHQREKTQKPVDQCRERLIGPISLAPEDERRPGPRLHTSRRCGSPRIEPVRACRRSPIELLSEPSQPMTDSCLCARRASG